MRVHVAVPAEEAPELPQTRSNRMPNYRKSYTGSVLQSSGARSTVTDTTVFPDPGDAVWQWEHRTGFKNYDLRATARIEDAYQRGLSRVRLKAGKMDDTPMELFFYDMIQFDPKTGNSRNIRRLGHDSVWQKLRRKANEISRLIETGRTQRVVFATYEKERQKLHKGMDRPDYNVCNMYKETGVCATIAKSFAFFAFSMLMVFLNAVWIGFDAEWNTAPAFHQSDIGWQAVEYVFCAFFVFEIVIRFKAFKRKRDSLRDSWFSFDLLLVALMVCEVWIIPIILVIVGHVTDSGPLHAVKELTVLRTIRLIRLTRLCRIARLLKAVPEVLTLLRGIAAAARSVFFTLLLLFVLLFVFGVVFKTQADEDFPALKTLFPTVFSAMWVLLLQGTFLDSPSAALREIGESSSFLMFVFLVFIFLSSFMVLNMLIGILCDVVHQVALNEKEEAAVAYLKSTLLEILECHDKDNDRLIHRDEFELLMRNPEMHFVLTRFGVNVVDLITLKDVLFEDQDLSEFDDDEETPTCPSPARGMRKLGFAEFLEVVLRLRGGNSATVTDIVDLREYVRQRFDRMDLRVATAPGPYSLSGLRSQRSMRLPRQVTFKQDDEDESQEPPLPTLLQEGGNEETASRLPKGYLRQPGVTETDALLSKVSDLSAAQQKWQEEMGQKQAELAGQLLAVQNQLSQVLHALEVSPDSRPSTANISERSSIESV
mmetsp:Transcript_9443/g.16759  ORF Transcript_9443/g.16759 Transcript_9443/m.16759 type:complete len:711 (-) Transcript_9443:92-2224(-)